MSRKASGAEHREKETVGHQISEMYRVVEELRLMSERLERAADAVLLAQREKEGTDNAERSDGGTTPGTEGSG